MPSQLGYWTIRGIGQPIRLLLAYVGEDFEDVLYELGDGPEFSRESWRGIKSTFGLDFPNLPYYIDGETKLSQSNTIIRHLARKYNLYGETEQEKDHVDLLIDQVGDLRRPFVQLCYGPELNDKLREEYVVQTKPNLEEFEKYLGDKQFFIGDKVTACDFHIYEILDQIKTFDPSVLAECPKLTEYLERFEELPAIKAYIASERFIARPIHNKCAHFV